MRDRLNHLVLTGTKVATAGLWKVEYEPEGEGFDDIEDWREGHRAYYGPTGVAVDDDDQVICVWFEVVDGTLVNPIDGE